MPLYLLGGIRTMCALAFYMLYTIEKRLKSNNQIDLESA